MARKKTPVPDELLALRARLTEWRNTHPPRSPLPEELWKQAATMASKYGVHRTARALPVDYANLNKRVGNRKPPTVQRTAAVSKSAPDFVDLMMSQPPQPSGPVVLELLRIKTHRPLDWVQLLTAWQNQSQR